MNTELKSLYTSKWADLERITQNDGVSWPLLLNVPQEYDRAKRRLLVVGQQTYGWDGYGDDTDGVAWLMEGYAHFALGRSYKLTPFWQAARELYALLNPDGPPFGFLWSNLVKVDQEGDRPVEHVEEAICELGLLSAELEIVRPEAVVFFTGHSYDPRLCSTFPALRFVQLGEFLVRLEHPALPFHTYRTPHPKWLRLKKHWDALERMALEMGTHVDL
jgi:hypothetical protein